MSNLMFFRKSAKQKHNYVVFNCLKDLIFISQSRYLLFYDNISPVISVKNYQIS